MQTFRGVEGYEAIQQKKPRKLPKIKSKKPVNSKINFAAWEVKKSYDDVIKSIGRNRKRILELFKQQEKRG